MVKLTTAVPACKAGFSISLRNRTLILGSCFADNLGKRMSEAGFRVCTNPFGTLYNPASIVSSLERLQDGNPFTLDDCVEMGAGAGLFCSFSHHSSFARQTAESWLEGAGKALAEASAFWHECDTLIVIPGNARVWEHGGRVVSNCLKRPASEFTNRMLETGECESLMLRIKKLCGKRRLVMCVCPIRQMGAGAWSNTLSKARLQLGVEKCLSVFESEGGMRQAAYFGASEILLDELRDYRFYAEDLVHPSGVAMDIIWERFLETFLPSEEKEILASNEKAARAAKHRSIKTERF